MFPCKYLFSLLLYGHYSCRNTMIIQQVQVLSRPGAGRGLPPFDYCFRNGDRPAYSEMRFSLADLRVLLPTE